MFKAFYSDPHIGHYNIIKYCNRPFSNIDEMNEVLISNYNKIIGINDIVLWVGDCFFKDNPESYRNILKNMVGSKILIMGNHDKSDTYMASLGFDLVLREAVMDISGVSCRINHYPSVEFEDIKDKHKGKRPKLNKGEILLHGHNHSKDKVTGKWSINIGVDAWDFCPALYSDVSNLVLDLAKNL